MQKGKTMAQITYRANLSAAEFPFISQMQGRTVVVPYYDQNFKPQVETSAVGDSYRDIGIPQIYYCHNVMPSRDGFQSIGYNTAVPAHPAEVTFAKAIKIRDGANNAAILGILSTGSVYVKRSTSNIWEPVSTPIPILPELLTFALISGVVYLYVANVGAYQYNFGTDTFDPITLTGLDPAAILGIVAVAGYLFAWTSNAVAWSSLIDSTDFTPSLITGAGGGNVEAIKGSIKTCVTNSLGVIVYSTSNAVAGLYSGNTRFPFNFRELVGSGGLSSAELVTADSNTGNHYAYTTSGLQLFSASQAQSAMPQVTDFISGQYFEDFDETTLEFSYTTVTNQLQKKLTLISGRYLVLSYGLVQLTHAIIYDVVTKRFGKAKITHVDCFEWSLQETEVIEIPRKSIAFLQNDGTIKTVDFSYTSSNSSGVIILGKYQHVRARLLQLDEAAIENFNGSPDCTVYDFCAVNGKTISSKTPGYLQQSADPFRQYLFSAVGINHSLCFIGGFSLTSIVLRFHLHGQR